MSQGSPRLSSDSSSMSRTEVRLVLAPLLGITSASYRRVFFSSFPGWSGALAPFIATTSGNESHPRRFKDILPENNPWHGVQGGLEPQLIGKSGLDFARNAQRMKDEWAYERINWNIGCPSGTVTAKSRGAGLLPYPDEIDRFLDEALGGFNGTITIKLRLGMYGEKEWEALVPILNRYPLGEVTIHGRTGIQQYKGRANVAESGRFLEAIRHPVLMNGDINTLNYALWLLEAFPTLSGLMIGRGALVDPLLATDIRTALIHGKRSGLPQELPDGLAPRSLPSTRMSKEQRKNYHDLILEELSSEAERQGGKTFLLGPLKELWSHWVPWFMNPQAQGTDRDKAERVVSRVLKTRNLDEYLLACERAWNSLI